MFIYSILTGQPESGAPEPVARAAAAAALTRRDVLGYTESFGLPALREKLSLHYEQYYNGLVGPNNSIPIRNIVVTTGSSGAFLLAFTACFDVGDVVAVASAGYPCYRNILVALGIDLVHIDVNDEFKLTATELQVEISRRAELNLPPIRGLILSSPSNPTGAMLSTNELRELCNVTEQYDIQFISDEIYHGITYDDVTRRADTAYQFSKQAIVINSFSKYYSSTYDNVFLVVFCVSLSNATRKKTLFLQRQ
jgi:aspartate/methionine/tyrosine aminotransferase